MGKLEAFRELTVFSFVLIIAAVIVAKLDGDTTASWFVMLTPLWFVDLVYLCLAVASLIAAVKEESCSILALLLATFLVEVILFVLFQLLLIFKIEGSLNIPFIAIGAPLMLIAVLQIAKQVYKFIRDEKKARGRRRR